MQVRSGGVSGRALSRSLSQSQNISANIDLIAKLRRQLEERDTEIAALRVRLHPPKVYRRRAARHTTQHRKRKNLLQPWESVVCLCFS